MKLRIVSDLHLDLYPYSDSLVYEIFGDDFDNQDTKDQTLILAGDILSVTTTQRHRKFFDILSERFKTVVLVAGNHDFWGADFINNRRNYIGHFEDTIAWQNIRFLDLFSGTCLFYDDVVLIGDVFYVDYSNNNPIELNRARNLLDFYKTSYNGGLFKPEHQYDWHVKSKDAIARACEQFKDKTKIIITHHAPSYKSCADQFKGDSLNPFFLSHLDDFVEETGAKLWIHGHVHNSNDYMIGNTRVISNPWGYYRGAENPQHIKNLVVEV